MILLTMALVIAAPNPATLNAPRKAYEACLRSFEAKGISDKMSKDTYSVAVKEACPAEAQALVNALVAYDTAMGSKRAAAEANAKLDIADYWTESAERLADRTSN